MPRELTKCPSCGGDMYHYAGCGIGEHGDRIASTPAVSDVPRVTPQMIADLHSAYAERKHDEDLVLIWADNVPHLLALCEWARIHATTRTEGET